MKTPMVWFIQLDDGPLIQVKNMKKAIERAQYLLRKPRHHQKTPFRITARDVQAAGGGWGKTRVLKL